MSDLELLKALQKELINTLEFRKKHYADDWNVTKHACRAKIHRLRMEIQEVMRRIERDCSTEIGYKIHGETWFKESNNG